MRFVIRPYGVPGWAILGRLSRGAKNGLRRKETHNMRPNCEMRPISVRECCTLSLARLEMYGRVATNSGNQTHGVLVHDFAAEEQSA